MIRRFKNSDADEVSALIRRTMQICNSNDYPEESIKQLTELFTSEYLIKRAEWTHFYVICEDNKIIGCGAIGPYWDKTDESCFFTIFVLPEYQGKGYGRLIIEALEHDEFFLKSKRIEMSVSPFSNLYICFSVSPPALAKSTSEYSSIGVSSGVNPNFS